ncbi:retrovirus-related pol polyprotein from transposon TNT 1-94 [Tanacetum coccineum]|uniref:Retrovirus-related pol polyprotein from transposon TNT 1-94 n=1 Tax=Tanacetum coccineum TaxID=301880 RepID=A0ABQ5HQQ7_9ASTR
MVIVRTLLVFVIHHNWHIAQMDINNAFIHKDLHEEVYMSLPQGYKHNSTIPQPVYKLQKSFYGLNQANMQWFTKLTTFLLHHGFTQSYADTSLFTYKKGYDFLVLLVYVDDILLTGNNITLIHYFKKQLDLTFSIKDLGNLNYYLGIELLRNLWIDNVSKEICFRVATKCQCKLIYLTITRLDLSYAVHALSQFSHSPRTPQWKALIKVLRPSHEGHRNTIELPDGNNVVLLRSDTIRLVQNGCSFHRLRSEDPIQHLKDYLRIVDSIGLNGDTRNATRLRLFHFSLHDQAINWLDRLPAGSISTWDDLTTRFLV